MSKKQLIEAIGDIENEFLEEYSSYVPKKRIQVYTVMKVLAACLALVLCAGAVWLWVGNDRSSQGNQEIVAKKDHKNQDDEKNVAKTSPVPKESSEPKQIVITEPPIMAVIVTQEPDNQNTLKPDTSYTVKADNNVSNELVEEPVQTPKNSENEPERLAGVVDIEETKVPDTQQNQSDKEETKVPDIQQKPAEPEDSEQMKPSDSDNIITASDWNKIDNVFFPCISEITELNQWQKEVQDYVDKNKDSSVTQKPVMDDYVTDKLPNAYIAGTVVTNMDGIRWNAEHLASAPVVEGWYWFDTAHLQWDKEYVLQRQKEKDNAMSNVLLIKDKAKLYIMQTKTDAKTLEEANAMYPEEIFNGNLNVTYQNGMPLYLIENYNGELYVRFLIEDTFVTIVDKGFGKDILNEMIKSVKKTF